MILQRNQAHSSVAQLSVLKVLLKWRDYAARIEDESTAYVMPNHVLFQMAKSMPTTRSEFRDCCRSNYTSILMKYQDDIVKIIDDKVKASKDKIKRNYQSRPNHHIVFENIQIPSNPEAAQEKKEQISKQVGEFSFVQKSAEAVTLEDGNLPEFDVQITEADSKK